MIFATPRLDTTLQQDLVAFDVLCEELGARGSAAGPWLGGLRRQWRAASAESSIEIEGFSVPSGERLAIASGASPADPSDEDRMALACYARAMDHVGAMASDEGFEWVERVVLDLHFDACHFQKDRHPGLYRKGAVAVTSPDGGPPAYVGPPAAQVRRLMREVMRWLRTGDRDAHLAVRAAMAHLHVVSVHPFADGNGRISRIVQSLVLARGGLLAPEFVTIEEYLGEHTADYYAALREVQGGSYQPQRDALPFVALCIEGHLAQARRRLLQLEEAAARWAHLERLVAQRGWPDRLVIALEQSLFDGTDRGTYAAEADISAPTASNDLRRLLDAGLVAQRGRGPATRYLASERLAAEVSRGRAVPRRGSQYGSLKAAPADGQPARRYPSNARRAV